MNAITCIAEISATHPVLLQLLSSCLPGQSHWNLLHYAQVTEILESVSTLASSIEALPPPIVRHIGVHCTATGGEHEALGLIKKMCWADKEKTMIAIADTNFRISVVEKPVFEVGQPVQPLKIVRQYTVKPVKASDTWVGLDSIPGHGILSALSSGVLSLHSESETKTRRVPSPLTVVKASPIDHDVFALAGKEVEVSLWNVTQTFASEGGETKVGDKRKKDEKELGEIWRAKNMPNNHLSLRRPVHHLCMCFLPTPVGESHHLIATGTKAGTVRRYDSRQRKPCDDWKVAKEGGIGCIEAGKDEFELFFADRSSTLGAMDLRTGRVLYTYSNMSATPHNLLSLPSSQEWHATSRESRGPRFGLASLASDATLRLHATNPPPIENPKQNVSKGAIVSHAGGVGLGDVLYMGAGDEVQHEAVSGDEKAKEEGNDEDVWEGMEDVEEGSEDGSEEEDDEEEESESESEDEEPPVKSKKARK